MAKRQSVPPTPEEIERAEKAALLAAKKIRTLDTKGGA
jgi:hypothetical protein